MYFLKGICGISSEVNSQCLEQCDRPILSEGAVPLGGVLPAGVWEKRPSAAVPVAVDSWKQPQHHQSWVEQTHQWDMQETQHSASLGGRRGQMSTGKVFKKH